MIRLRVRDADGERVFESDADSLTLGRLADCGLALSSGALSRRHAEIARAGGAYLLRDLESRNGTFLNGARVSEAPIAAGDEIALGSDVTILVLDAGAAGEPRSGAREGAGADEESDVPPVRGPRAPAGWLRETVWSLRSARRPDRAFVLPGPLATVGQDAGATLRLAHETVARMHARLDDAGDRLLVTDLKSAHGTFVNGERVRRATLGPGDDVRFGALEFRVERSRRLAKRRLLGPAGAAAALALLLFALPAVLRAVSDWERDRAIERAFLTKAVESTRAGIAAYRAGDRGLAYTHLSHARDLLRLGDLVDAGTAADPARAFAVVRRRLPGDEAGFDFERALDPGAVQASGTAALALDDRPFVDREVQRYLAELGVLDPVPPGFLDQVWSAVQEHVHYPDRMRTMMRRARVLEPRLRQILDAQSVPEAFCYVAWQESDLDSLRESPAHALGLWQLMPDLARDERLRVDAADPRRDQRTSVTLSTRAAGRYIASLLRDQGPENFLLVLASYNRGHNALGRLKQLVPDPRLRAMAKYWYLVTNRLLPEETRNYVPRIFAIRVIAENPQRFRFS